MSATLDRYLREIGRHELLTREQEAELSRRVRAGDMAARERLVAANLRFVVSVARRYRNRGVPLADLVEEGNLGLLRAAERFDGSRGVRFVTYAVWWVRQAMRDAIRRASDGREVGLRPVSLDGPVGGGRSGGGGTPLRELVPDTRAPDPGERVQAAAVRRALDLSLAGLPEREERVLRRYYGMDGEPAGMGEIAEELGVSRERVRQLKDRALARLRIAVERGALRGIRA